MSCIDAFGTGKLTFSAHHATVDDRFQRLRVAALTQQHDFAEVEIRELPCRTGCGARSAGNAKGGARLGFQQLFVQLESVGV
jgi:hypothetical protein